MHTASHRAIGIKHELHDRNSTYLVRTRTRDIPSLPDGPTGPTTQLAEVIRARGPIRHARATKHGSKTPLATNVYACYRNV